MSSRRSEQLPRTVSLFFLLIAFLSGSCGTSSDRANRVIAFDLNRLDENGLQGPSEGLRALHYEFCIPASQECVDEVTRIDTTLVVMKEAKGRIRCSGDEYLCLGNTHQKAYADVLVRLAQLPYVQRIEESFFEH
jgi:hypothetical protein